MRYLPILALAVGLTAGVVVERTFRNERASSPSSLSAPPLPARKTDELAPRGDIDRFGPEPELLGNVHEEELVARISRAIPSPEVAETTASLSVLVRDLSGDPVAGVPIDARRRRTISVGLADADEVSLEEYLDRAIRYHDIWTRQQFRGVTDANGRAFFDVPNGDYEVFAGSPVAKVRQSPKYGRTGDEVEFVAERRKEVFFEVDVAEGAEYPERFWVRVQSPEGRRWRMEWTEEDHSTYLPAGAYTATCTSRLTRADPVDFTILEADDTRTIHLTLRPSSTIDVRLSVAPDESDWNAPLQVSVFRHRGQEVEPSGDALFQKSVELPRATDLESLSPGARRQRSRLRAGFGGLDPGRYWITVERRFESAYAVTDEVTIEASEARVVPVQVPPVSENLSTEVVIIAPDGTAVEKSAQIQVTGDNGACSAYTVHASGRWRARFYESSTAVVDLLNPQLDVRHPQYGTARVPFTLGARHTVRFERPSFLTIETIGKGATRTLRVDAHQIDGSDVETGWTVDQGRSRLGPLSPGTYRVQLSTGNGVLVSDEIVLGRGENSITLEVPVLHSVRFDDPRDSNGMPFSYRAYSLSDEHSPSPIGARSFSSRGIELDGLPAGSYRVIRSSRRRTEVMNIVLPGPATVPWAGKEGNAFDFVPNAWSGPETSQLAVGDVVYGMGGDPFGSLAKLRTLLHANRNEEQIKLMVDRGGALIEITLNGEWNAVFDSLLLTHHPETAE